MGKSFLCAITCTFYDPLNLTSSRAALFFFTLSAVESAGERPLPNRSRRPMAPTRRGLDAMDCSYALLDMTVYGRQETWEDSPPGWPQRWKGVDRVSERIFGTHAEQHRRQQPRQD